MAQITLKPAGPDHPIFKQGVMIGSVQGYKPKKKKKTNDSGSRSKATSGAKPHDKNLLTEEAAKKHSTTKVDF